MDLKSVFEGGDKNILFIHGGPGSNMHPHYEFIKRNYIDSGKTFWFYNQPGCGDRVSSGYYSHTKNTIDLREIIERAEISFDLVIGHSYGAMLLYDTFKANTKSFSSTKILLLSMSINLNTPRYNNLAFEMSTIGQENLDLHRKFYEDVDKLKSDSWKITKKIRSENTNASKKYNWYWINQLTMDEFNIYAKKYPSNERIFFDVRQSIYDNCNKTNYFDLSYDNIHHAIGAFDLLMGGIAGGTSESKIFYSSAHYPHIEQSKEFQLYIDEILK